MLSFDEPSEKSQISHNDPLQPLTGATLASTLKTLENKPKEECYFHINQSSLVFDATHKLTELPEINDGCLTLK